MNAFLALIALCLVAKVCSKTITWDFEDGLGDLEQNPDNTVVWKQSPMDDIRKYDKNPIPGSPDGSEGVAFVDLLKQVSGRAAMKTPWLNIPDGGKVSLSYFIRAYLPKANAVQVAYQENAAVSQETILDLYATSLPHTDEWYEASAEIPSGLKQPLQIWVYGIQGTGTEIDVVAIDNLSVKFEDNEVSDNSGNSGSKSCK